MNLFLERNEPDAICTTGTLFIDGKMECVTLEPPPRDNQPKVSSIPEGTYRVIVTESPHFQRYTPELLSVPGRQDIRIHPGNWVKDTEGCILVGIVRYTDAVYNSEKEFESLLPKIQAAIERNESVFITIQDAQPEAA